MKIAGATGAISVFTGAVSYGMPGVILSLATMNGARIDTLIPTQFLFSFVFFFVLSEWKNVSEGVFYFKDKLLVLATGIPLLFITYCFYNAVLYIGVSTSTLFIMQSAWIAPVVNSIIKRERIKYREIFSFMFIMLGVVTATGVFHGELQINYHGVFWGLAAAISYSIVIISSANVANGVRVIDKAKMLTFGAFLASLFLFNKDINITPVSEGTLWSVVNAFFGSILPVVLYGYGMPRTNPSLAGMLVTTELPAAFFFSYLLLSDSITTDQIAGCIIIIVALLTPTVFTKLKRKMLK